MDTSQIKRFAVEARNILKQGVINRITALGFDEKGEVAERNKPQHLQGKTLFMGQLYDENFYGKWMALYNRVRTKGVKEVYEEAAYTWFNRMMAIRIMEKNGFTDPILSFDDDRLRIPRIVSNARAGQAYVNDESDREKLSELLMDDTKTTEQFTLLITAFCHSNPVINNCFGGVSDYTEILLPTNILSEGGFVDLLNHTSFITDDDYRQSELIGWLYQFYISEKKDEVFASFKGGKKAAAEDIPAATQIFTPNWIVKYMVQNTVGRIFLDNNPNSDLKDKWKYLVEPSTPTPDDCIFKYDDPKELTMADLGCGSGHILNEGFDILYDIYIEEGYSRKQAIENIFKYNLTGIDLDTRAKQLATFALMMKACQKDDSFLDCHVMPNVQDMPEVKIATWQDLGGHLISALQTVDWPDATINKELNDCFELMEKANNLGSIMKFKISQNTRKFIVNCIEEKERQGQNIGAFVELFKGFELILTLTNKYAAVVMNPPYMGSGNMNAELSQYVSINYPEGKADLCTAMMMMQANSIATNGFYANIVPPSWMFLSTFESLRRKIIDNNSICSLLHLSRGVFGADFGSVSCVIQNNKNSESKGTYFRLIERTFQEFDQKHLQLLFEKTLSNHDFRYYFADYTKDVEDIEYSEIGAKIYYPNVSQKNFERIPGTPIGYWLSDNMLNLFQRDTLSETNKPRAGLSTTDNDRFLRFWHEVSINKIYFEGKCRDDLKSFERKWVPMTKGGTYRRWYGNHEYVLNFEKDGEELKYWLTHNPNDPKTKSYSRYIRNYDKYCQAGISFSDVACGNPHFRWENNGLIPNSRGPYIYTENKVVLGFLNGKVAKTMLELLCPTLTFNVGDIGRLPYIDISEGEIKKNVEKCIAISRQDWDAHETSWDFATNELLTINESNYHDILNDYSKWQNRKITPAVEPNKLEWRVMMYKMKWEYYFELLKRKEEELNRQFIEIYGLQDELDPYVPDEDITILQQGEIRYMPIPGCDGNYSPSWNEDVLMKQLISYSIGCMMGRYRLDREGLWIAHPNPTSDEICTYHYNGNDYTIDDDGIMPLMSRDCGFDDNGVLRFTEFLRVAFGEKELTTNLNFVEECLGKTIEDYLKKDFWKDHKKMYQNRPIYWLFSSKKGAFQVLAYMHRMNPYTVEQIRNKYLLPHIDYLTKKIDEMEMKEATLSTSERKTLQKLKTDLVECQEYHERLHLVADQQIGFDLDDGVVVNYAKFGDVVAKIK